MRLALALLMAVSLYGQALHPAGSRLSQRRLASWYVTVDSVNGNDANDGKRGAPKATIPDISVMPAGRVMGFARGSQWRAQVSAPANWQAYLAFGTGERPLLDASDVIAAGSWSKTGGRTNIYQASLAIDASVPTGNFVNVFEDEVFLVRAASLDALDTTPGAYYPSADGSTPITLYIHATGDGNPAANGKTYEYTRRAFGLSGIGRTGLTIRGIYTRRNLWFDGSMFSGRNALVENCRTSQGSKHNLFVAGGTTVRNTVVDEAYYGPSGSKILAVYYDLAANGENVLFDNVTASLATFNSLAVALGGHSGSGTYGTITFRNCTATRFSSAYSADNAATVLVDHSAAVLCDTGASMKAPTSIVRDFTSTNNVTQAIGVTADNVNLTVERATGNVTGGAAHFVYSLNKANSVVSISDSTITGCPGWHIQLTGTGAQLTSLRNTFPAAGAGYYDIQQAGFTLVSDYNTFGSATTDIRLAGTLYTDLAAYRTATGQDAHSTPAP